jgi:GTP cyclohydrolase I
MAGEKPTPIFRSEVELSRLPASDRIRYRLIGAQCRYHANHNTADHTVDG